MKRSQLLLPPAASTYSRIWITLPKGCDALASAAKIIDRSPLLVSRRLDPLIVENSDHSLATYATAISVFVSLSKRLAGTPATRDLKYVIDAMREAQAVEIRLDAAAGLEQATQHNGDALAALRRISRESAESSTLIDRAARHFNTALSSLDHSHVVIANTEQIDRPSLKVLARACLITSRDAPPPIWIWTQATLCEPSVFSTIDAMTELPLHARRGILFAIKQVLEPVDSNFETEQPLVNAPLDKRKPDFGIGGATGRLANLNYDGCAEWLAKQRKPNVDTCRLAALLMVNLGLYDAAIDTLSHAIERCHEATLKCHMWYISGLVWSKRCYNLEQSNHCFDRAEAALEQMTVRDPGDPAMERAWVQNGRAMNAILAARFAGQPVKDAFPVAFNNLRRAFDLVREGRTRDRVYLRYNLLGNMSNLMEIGGNFSVALDLLKQTFDESLAYGTENEREWLAQQRCMRAALMARSGDFAAAVPIFAEARALMIKTDRPVSAEALARSEATARFQSGDIEGAKRVFSEGMTEARRLRSRLGVEIHTAGLAACNVAAGRTKEAIALLKIIGDQEDVWLIEKRALDRGDLSNLCIRDTYFGLSLSIPEVDLEDMAPVSIAGALRGRQSEVASARTAER